MTDLFEYAQSLASRGMLRALDTAEADNPDFGELAYGVILRLAQRQETVHIDDFLKATTLRPSSPNAMGAIWQRAIKRKIITHSGRVKACTSDPVKKTHCYPVYASLIFRVNHE